MTAPMRSRSAGSAMIERPSGSPNHRQIHLDVRFEKSKQVPELDECDVDGRHQTEPATTLT